MLETQQQRGTIERFLIYYPSKNTKKVYKCVLKKFFAAVKCDPDEYFRWKRDYEADLYDFALSIQQYAPKSFHSYVVIIKQFFLENNVEVNSRVFKRIRRLKPGTRALTRDRLPSNKELKRILSHSDLRMKSLILTLLSSGMRIGEATKLAIGDIDFDKNPTRVYLRSGITKTKEPRITFISDEAALYLREWVKQHDSYLISACNRLNLPDKTKDIKDNRVFPFNESSVNSAFKRLLRLSGLNQKDPETARHIIHVHVFRKFFRTKMALAIPTDIVETLMGHSGYLTSAYIRYSEEEWASHYTKGMGSISVFEKGYSEEIKALEDEIRRRDKKIEQIEGKMDKFAELGETLKFFKKHQKEIKKRIEKGMGVSLTKK